MKNKFILGLTLILSCLSLNSVVKAEDYKIVNEKDIILDNETITKASENNLPIETNVYGKTRAYGTYARKSNVRVRNEWSGYRAVSHTVKASSAGASISTDRTTSFGTSISGDISKLNIGTNASVSSTIGYTLNIPANKTAYLGFRVLYRVETGTRTEYLYDGKVYKKSNYTVKTPIRGEYALIYR